MSMVLNIYGKLGDHDRAIQRIKLAMEEFPDEPELLTHLGEAYLHKGEKSSSNQDPQIRPIRWMLHGVEVLEIYSVKSGV
jgi:hypothetical protein